MIYRLNCSFCKIPYQIAMSTLYLVDIVYRHSILFVYLDDLIRNGFPSGCEEPNVVK